MNREKRYNKYVWVIMTVLPLPFIVWTLFVFSRGDAIIETAFTIARYPFVAGYIVEAALGFQSMAMSEPVWEGIWIGIRIILFFWI